MVTKPQESPKMKCEKCGTEQEDKNLRTLYRKGGNVWVCKDRKCADRIMERLDKKEELDVYEVTDPRTGEVISTWRQKVGEKKYLVTMRFTATELRWVYAKTKKEAKEYAEAMNAPVVSFEGYDDLIEIEDVKEVKRMGYCEEVDSNE